MVRQSSAGDIANAALAILIEEGASAVTMRRVATAAGVTPMATYKHYANRESLLRAVADMGFQALEDAWAMHAEAADCMTRLFGLLDDFLDFALGNPNLYRFLITDQRERARQFPEDFRVPGVPAFSPVLEAVEQGIREGLLREDDPLEATLAITAQAQGLVQLYLGGRVGLTEKDFRQLCHRTTRRTLDGLRK